MNRNDTISDSWTYHRKGVTCGDCELLNTRECHYANFIPRRTESDTEAETCLKLKLKKSAQEIDTPVSAYFDRDRHFVSKRVGDEIMSQYRFLVMSDNKCIYYYENGVYLPYGEKIIRQEVRKRLGERATNHYVSEVLEYIRDMKFTERDNLYQNPNLINLRNGIYDVESGELLPHSPEKIFLQQHPIHFYPKATCPAIDKFLEEVLPNEKDREAVYQLLGYCLYRGYEIQKAFLLVGDGENGKSTLINLLKAFIGEKNVTSTSLQELEGNRFASSRLFAKNANLFSDLPERALNSTSLFKMCTGGDPITAEYKFGKPFDFKNHAKMVFSANCVPRTRDESHAFFRRWNIILFPNKFDGDKRDTKIIEKLTTTAELSGLFNKAMEALRKLLAESKFSNEKPVNDIRDEYVRKSDPIQAFVWDFIEVDSESYVTKAELYAAFLGYCKEKGYVAPDQRIFHKSLPSKVPVGHYQPKEGDGARPHCWKGIRLRENNKNSKNNVSPTFNSTINYNQEENTEKTVLPVRTVPDSESMTYQDSEIQNSNIQSSIGKTDEFRRK